MPPLLAPDECSILLIDPARRNIERVHTVQEGNHELINRHALIQQAAHVLDVPKFFVFSGDATDKREWLVEPCDPTLPRVYTMGAGSLWASSGIATALAEEGRACLILCGFWLEGSVTFAALNALADGFDVFVLMDACPTCDRHSQCPAIKRLLQAGVVPLTTTQMVREWAEVATDEGRRSSLLKLLARL